MFERARGRVLRWRAGRQALLKAPSSLTHRLAMAERAISLHNGLADERAASLTMLAQLQLAGRPGLAEASARDAISLRPTPQAPWPAELAEVVLAWALRAQERHAEAELAARAAIDRLRGRSGRSGRLGLPEALVAAGASALTLDRPEDAAELLEEATRVSAQAMSRHPLRATSLNLLARSTRVGALARIGRADEAVRIGTEVLPFVAFGARHGSTKFIKHRVWLLQYLAQAHEAAGDVGAARDRTRAAVAAARAATQPSWLRYELKELARLLSEPPIDPALVDEADDALREAIDLSADGDPGELANLVWTRGDRLWAANQLESSRLATQSMLPVLREKLPNDWRLAVGLSVLGQRAAVLGWADAAVSYVDESVAIARHTHGQPPDMEPLLARMLTERATALWSLERTDDALDGMDDAIEEWRRADPGALGFGGVLTQLAEWLCALDRYGEAVGPARDATHLLRKRHVDGNGDRSALAGSLHTLGIALSGVHAHTGAIDAMAECTGHLRALVGAGDTGLRTNLVRCLRQRAQELAVVDRLEESLVDASAAVRTARALASDEELTLSLELRALLKNQADHRDGELEDLHELEDLDPTRRPGAYARARQHREDLLEAARNALPVRPGRAPGEKHSDRP